MGWRPREFRLFPYTTLFRSCEEDIIEGLEGARAYSAVSLQTLVGAGIDGTELGDLFGDRKSTRLNSSHVSISYAVFCLKKKILVFSLRPKLDLTPNVLRILT